MLQTKAKRTFRYNNELKKNKTGVVWPKSITILRSCRWTTLKLWVT